MKTSRQYKAVGTDEALVRRLKTVMLRCAGGPDVAHIQAVQREVLQAAPGATGEPFGRNDSLVLSSGDGVGWRIPLRTLPVTLGRGSEADYRIDDAGVSRIHCRLERDGPFVMLRDVASANGTCVNGARTVARQLCVGDVITLGEIRLTVGRG